MKHAGRTSRWSADTTARNSDCTVVNDDDGNAFPTAVTSFMTSEQLDILVAHLRIQEIVRILRLPESFITLPRIFLESSSDPEYDCSGHRTKTPAQRYRQALESERHGLVERATGQLPSYHPPRDYRRPTRFSGRVQVPAKDYPSGKFVGQILGPRGTSLKEMEARLGVRIFVRGKGSVKEGKSRSITSEPLHVLITGSTQGQVNEGKKAIEQVIDTAISSPEVNNFQKQKQLRELAIMNGTYRDDEGRLRGPSRLVKAAPNAQHSAPDLSRHFGDAFEQEYRQLRKDVSANEEQPQVLEKLPPWRADRLCQRS
ncbi:branchpoint-bridging protein [Emericellopsis cladophorae]|uniref:Branchpoint-bridging protein n=1 Tax=Emericellopsis cladophorae TaxID=2686198 RepID=A0A9Q0BEV6_9HYPO|nr:branchpoint-bridging protein [Emericellopsis cladophorae]KAI6783317.1 branchpoint-bridging protein [Emericellopsis cladophorae]